MAVIYMNPDKLNTAIQDLRDFADDCTAAMTSIDNKCAEEHDPMDLAEFRTKANDAIDGVNGRADDLEKAKDAIIAVNESGVGSMTANGGISCEVPDDTTIDTIDDLTAWSQATIDAHDLQTILGGRLGSKSNGRTYDQVIESIREHSGDPAYAAALINAIGPENLTSLPLEVAEYYTVSDDMGTHDLKREAGTELAELLGTLLASASTTWDKETCESMATTIKESVDDKGEWGRITVLNAMLGGHDADGDYVNDLEFNSVFLTALANSLDDLDWNTIKSTAKSATTNTDSDIARYDKKNLGPYLDNQSFDPLAGVLDAMGNNPQAALDYLAKASESGDGADMALLEELSKRDWDEQGFAGFTAAVAAASSQRASDNQGIRDRADDLAGHAIHYLATNTNEDIYNDDAKARVALLLANCPAEVTRAWTGSSVLIDPSTGQRFPAAEAEDINALGYRVADSSDATATIAAQLGQYAHDRAQQSTASHADDPDTQINDINNAYERATQAAGYLAGLADKKAGDINSAAQESADARSEAAKTAISVISTVAGAGFGVVGGPPAIVAGASTGYSVACTLLAPVVEYDAAQVESAAPSGMDLGLRAAAIQDAANAGLLDPEDYTITGDSEKTYTWIVPDPDRANSDGSPVYTIDLSAADDPDNAAEEVDAWADMIQEQIGDYTFKEILDDFNGSYASGYQSGSSYGG
ncbi:DUF6571 family protein [Actinomyces sp. MRS3W]|uniref:DUF6571 family protein n=1 Tax=Actinomyces sp. MRS3W TaxID=2800796 RepID=UPI0028FD6855|nr:DUF6571 family protein [Actinomyces sp. MRS3W]MDU0349696.1 DUF6571 family protein [Actinomyces sp. MRS3W]